MKYLKYISESKEYKYNKGDYVLLVNDEWYVQLECLITIVFISRDNPNDISYYVRSYHPEEKEFKEFWVDEDEIQRKLTKAEKKEYEIFLISLKYNL